MEICEYGENGVSRYFQRYLRERAERAKKADRARGRARRRQWLTMLYPALGALLIVGLFGALWNGLQRREGRPSGRGGDA